MSVSWYVNGVDLDTHFIVESGTTWRPPVSARNYMVEVPGRHGAISSGAVATYDPAIVTLRIHVTRSTWAEMESAAELLEALLTGPKGVGLTRVSGTVTAYATGYLQSLTHDPSRGTIPAQDWTAVFQVPGVFFRGASTTTELWPWDGLQAITALAGSSAPVADASFRVTGPCSQMTLSCPVSGTNLSWSGTLNAAQYLFLHPGRLEAWISAVSTAWDGTGQQEAGNLTYNANGPLQLWPSVSGTTLTTSVTVAGSGRASGQTALWIRARKAYL